jgi:hypothetical protein
MLPMQRSVATLVKLIYPNGRAHESEVPADLKPGAEFDLYGRRWRVIGPVPQSHAYRYAKLAQPRVLCRPI